MLRNISTELIDKIAVQQQDAIKTLITSAELVRVSKKPNTPVNFFESFFKAAKKHILI